ncbi:hypothetical protein OZX57_06335 [Bifidobacterium sp. ESL0682]|uniref:hypothetical protein n=1 Tax=Bifidobacterium sp. ESL0682 TaxID=2983212 RepID=UPI0023F6DFFF|nr:hypothetical protein [Bifidobacterium sp. ESL0682]WEV41604.1 hypothetical protein OZX57_06335 [Bifidobacterium sp. ESL0682]
MQLLSRIESYARVSDYAEMNGAASVSVDQVSMPVTPLQAQDSMTSETMGAAGVSPLIDENATAAFATPTVPAPQPEASYQATQASSSPFDMSSQTGQNFGIDTSSPASFDFNVTAADTATPVIPDLPDNAVVPGETATSQNSSAETTNFGSTTDTNGDSSLAALASMAHTSTTEPSSNQTVSFAPPSPTISALSTPPQAPEPSAASSADASADANTDAATQTLFASNDNHAATAGDNSLGDSDDVDIPSLSFPDFNVSGTDSPKTGE